MRQTFKLEAANRTAQLALWAISLACFALAIVTSASLSASPLAAWLATATSIGLGMLFGWFAWAQRSSSVTIDDRQIELRLPFYGRTLAIDQIVQGSHRKVDLAADQGRRLAWRTNGLSVPGYHLGWFRTQSNDVALAAVTGPNVVTWSTKAGPTFLLSIAEADAFLAALSQKIAKA